MPVRSISLHARSVIVMAMDPNHGMVNEQLDHLDETLSLTTRSDQRAAYYLGCQFLIGLSMDPALSTFTAERMREIRAKYGLA